MCLVDDVHLGGGRRKAFEEMLAGSGRWDSHENSRPGGLPGRICPSPEASAESALSSSPSIASLRQRLVLQMLQMG